MSYSKKDKVDVRSASLVELAVIDGIAGQVKDWNATCLRTSNDPNTFTFFAFFDGTGNDAKDSKRVTTNIGHLASQFEKAARSRDNIGGVYLEGPGTQGGLKGFKDGVWGGSYHERIALMKEAFDAESSQWLLTHPSGKVCVISAGFSRGAEQAAGFSRLVSDQGVLNEFNTQIIPGSDIAQSQLLFDPVGTGEPVKNDRRPPPEVLSSLQLTARDELRKEFASSVIVPPGMSKDGRFFNPMGPGAHADMGGGYKDNGLSDRYFNISVDYLNRVAGEEIFTKKDIEPDLEKDVVHDSCQHLSIGPLTIYKRLDERLFNTNIDPDGRPIEPVNESLCAQYAVSYAAASHSLINTQDATDDLDIPERSVSDSVNPSLDESNGKATESEVLAVDSFQEQEKSIDLLVDGKGIEPENPGDPDLAESEASEPAVDDPESPEAYVAQPSEPDEPDQPDVAEPEVPAPKVDEPEAPEPDAPEQAVDEPEPTEPDVAEPEAQVPAVEDPESSEADVAQPSEPDEPDQPDVAEPEAPAPTVDEPEAPEPDAPEPAAEEPEPTEPDAAEPEAPEPAVEEPAVAEPSEPDEPDAPEVAEPELSEPEPDEPEAPEPDVTEPEAQEPAVEEPESAEPDVAEPDVAEPSEPDEPDEPDQPEVAEPEAPEPAIEAPESPEPGAVEEPPGVSNSEEAPQGEVAPQEPPGMEAQDQPENHDLPPEPPSVDESVEPNDEPLPPPQGPAHDI
jgi:hypothetical protein